jgi:F-type H+-transporting ATPase subunit b
VADILPSPGAPVAFGDPLPATETSATTAVATGEAHEEATLMGLGPETWVYVSMTIFFALAIIVGKLPARIAGALDARIAAVRRQLDEARNIRAEAEALLVDANRAREAAGRDADAIIARAHAEAAELVAESETAAALTIERRTAAAEAKIAAAERAAEAELRADVARRVTAAARSIIAGKADAGLQSRLTDDAIAGLERRLH